MRASNPEVVVDVVRVYRAAAECFVDLVRRLPADRWDGPGLGEWDLRALVGHTSRSLVTVITYLDMPADQVDIAAPRSTTKWPPPWQPRKGPGWSSVVGVRVSSSAPTP